MSVYQQGPLKYLVGSLMIFTACAEVDLSDSQDSTDKLLGGQITSIRPEIGRLSLNGTLCTATLIRSQVVISAAHCVGYRTRSGRLGDFVVERNGKAYRFPIDGVYSYGDRLGEKDIALLHLSQVVPNTIAQPTSIALYEPTQGEVTIFGYGCSNRRTRRGPRRKQLFTHDVTNKSNNLCPGDSGGPVVVGTNGPVFKINSGYYTSGRRGDIYGSPTRHYREMSAYANVMNEGGLSELRAFIRRGGVDQEGGEDFVGGGSTQQDEAPPQIQVISPADQSEFPERSVIEILAKVTDDSGYVQPELIWDFNGNSYPCPHRSQYVSCEQEGAEFFRWKVEVGEGLRSFHISALDLAGKVSTSESRTLYLGDAANAGLSPGVQSEPQERPAPPEEPQTQTPPQITVLSPTSSAPESSSVQIIAQIESEAGVREAHLAWGYNQERYPCPTRQTYADCDISGSQYIWTVRVTSAGARPFHIEAIDGRGQVGYSDSYQIDVISAPSDSTSPDLTSPDSTPIERDETPPQIWMLEPSIDEFWQENSEVYITAQITDSVGVATAKLRWDFNGTDYPCPHRSQYVDCDISGDLYQWVLRVSDGSRSFKVWAEDSAGNYAESEHYQIVLHP